MSARELLAVYQDRDGNWTATVRQGCIIEQHVVLRRSLNCFDDASAEARAEAWEKARALV